MVSLDMDCTCPWVSPPTHMQVMRDSVQQCLKWVDDNRRAFQGNARAVQAQVAAQEAAVRAFKQQKLQEALAAA